MKITCSLFPKFFQSLNSKQLADLVSEFALDSINAVVRDGYWIEQSNLAASCKQFCTDMRAHGVDVYFATAAGLNPFDLVKDPEPLQILHDNGIKQVRIGYFKRDSAKNIQAYIGEIKKCVDALADISAKIGIRCISQLHHGTVLTNPSLAWHVCADSNPAGFGIMVDTGNQCHEGMDNWPQSLALLGAHLAAIGIKNARPTFSEDGRCRRQWVALDQGEVYFPDFAQACKDVQFSGPFIHMPFYHQDDESKLRAQLQVDIHYLRDVFAALETPTENEQ